MNLNNKNDLKKSIQQMEKEIEQLGKEIEGIESQKKYSLISKFPFFNPLIKSILLTLIVLFIIICLQTQ